ncbi:MAG: hypothetical protein ABIM40_01815 [Pseudomonadota bacterium]
MTGRDKGSGDPGPKPEEEAGRDLDLMKKFAGADSDEEFYAYFLSQGKAFFSLPAAAGLEPERVKAALDLAARRLGRVAVERMERDARSAGKLADSKGLGLWPPEPGMQSPGKEEDQDKAEKDSVGDGKDGEP